MASRKQKGAPHTQASQLDPGLRYSFLEYRTQNPTQASGFPEFTQVSMGCNVFVPASWLASQQGLSKSMPMLGMQESTRGPWEGDGLAPPTEVCWPCPCVLACR